MPLQPEPADSRSPLERLGRDGLAKLLGLKDGKKLTPEETLALGYNWKAWARPKQLPPEGDGWDGWLILGGRGGGKTRTGAEWVRDLVENQGYRRIALIGETSADGKGVMVDGDSGILQCCPPWNKPKFTSSSSKGRPKLEWPNGAIATLYDAREPDQLRGPQHDACFVAGTMVAVPGGEKPIERIRTGDLVLTRHGPRRVLWVGDRDENVGVVKFTTGAILCGTADHPVYTPNGWMSLSALKRGDEICAIGASSGAESVGTPTTAGTTSTAARDGSGEVTGTGYIVRYGASTTARFPKGTKSTTGTKTYSTTVLRIWNACRKAATGAFTSLANLFRVPIPNPTFGPATTAARASSGSFGPKSRFAADARGVEQSGAGRQRAIVGIAAFLFCPAPATFAASVASTWVPAGRSRVYNLQVDEHPEYFANGVLVHNCWVDELAKFRYAQDVYDQMLLGLRLGKKPRWLATTTPRPIPLILKLVKDPHVIVTRYSSRENLNNLAKSFVHNVIDRYFGTRLGRQEIDAEILEDIPGALWSRKNLDENRVHMRDVPPLVRVTVAVDPAITSNDSSAETGIVVGGVSEKSHGYILEDASLRGSPDQWARTAVAMYRKFEADHIVAEANQGGDMVERCIRAVATDVPVTLVRATRGKYVRAEPASSVYEQNRVSHVGVLADLEDQMVGFTPERAATRVAGELLDRTDALVWLITDLFQTMTVPSRVDRTEEYERQRQVVDDGRNNITGY